jgi:hypothetical protein
MRLLARVVALAAVFTFVLTAEAAATPVATNEGSYQALGRVFPDPMAGCQNSAGTCSPYAQGNVPATQFIGIDEFVDAIKFMNSKPQWQRYMEILAVDGKLGDGAGNGKNPDIPGNNLDPEYTPNPEGVSAGLPTTDLDRKKSDLMVVRVTDESVPDKGKKRYALSLSIHGIERAGAEGGIRAMEDLVTAHDTGLATQKVVKDSIVKGAPTFDAALKKSIIYFTLPNPDGWRRGSVSSGGVFFQRYNGNGVDPNRDWPDIGFAFRGYSAVSEPETKAWIGFYGQVRKHGAFSAGDDLHGQPEADALSYTLLPHGRHLYDKNVRIQESAKAINRSTYDRISWSPIVQPNDAPHGGGAPCSPDVLGTACAKIYAQTWGSVYDTINYTTTGALGDWFDSAIGLHADGIDNEMSFSHLDKNINFDPHTEQLHVDGNKALIYAHLAQMLTTQKRASFDAGGRKGYVPNLRIKRAASQAQPQAPAGSVPQDDINSGPIPAAQSDFPFTVQRGQVGNKNVFSGGMRVEVTDSNIQGIGSGQVTLAVQCRNCDQHRGAKDDNEWVTVAEDYNQSFLYAQSGVVATVNNPQPFQSNGRPVEWRTVVGGPTAAYVVKIHFTSGRASEDGNTGGDAPPQQRAYNVANTDFFKDLNPFIPGSSQDLRTIDPRKVIAGKQSLSGFDTIALADNALPGYVGELGGVSEQGGPPTKDFTFESTASVGGGGGCPSPANCEEKEFTIAPQDGNSQATVKITWADGNNDFDLTVYSVDSAGKRTQIGRSAGGSPGRSEEVVLPDPNAGKYVIVVENYAAADPTWHGSVKFDALPARPKSTFTKAQKNDWFLALSRWVNRGGTLVLTDGALKALPDLTNNEIRANAIARETVYAGQSAFSTDGNDDTLKDALARDIAQPGARFNTGMRRQMYEPTPLGFAIQNSAGADSSYARQYDVDTAAWKKAGGRYVAGSADAGARDAEANYNKVTIGELKMGSGRIRIAGALLPQPTERYDHQFGLEPYATTYSGYVMARNLLESINRGKGAAGSIGGRFVISGRRVKMKKGSRVVGVRVSCRTPLSCRGTLTLFLKRGKKLSRIGRRSFFYRTKTPDTVLKVTVSSSALRVLRTQRRTIVYASAPVKFRDGLKGVARSSFPVYRP